MHDGDLTRSDRWHDAAAYRRTWAARSAALLALYDAVSPPKSGLRIAEIGCGAHSPVWQLCRDRPGVTVDRYDLCAWDADVRVLDLNGGFTLAAGYDLVTLTGVAEYLNDFPAVCARLLAAGQVLALSYAPMPLTARHADPPYLRSLRRRILRNGWRSHLFLDEVVAALSGLGVVVNVGDWNGQALFILRRFDGAGAPDTRR